MTQAIESVVHTVMDHIKREHKDLTTSDVVSLIRASTHASKRISAATKEQHKSWNLAGEDMAMPLMHEYVTNTRSGMHAQMRALLCLFPEVMDELPTEIQTQISHGFRNEFSYSSIYDASSLPILLDPAYLQSCQSFGVVNASSALNLLGPAVGVPFNFYLPEGKVETILGPSNDYEVGDCLITFTVGEIASAYWTGGSLLNQNADHSIPNNYLNVILDTYLQELDKEAPHLRAKVVELLRGATERCSSGVKHLEESQIFKQGMAHNFLQLKAIPAVKVGDIRDLVKASDEKVSLPLCVYVTIQGKEKGSNSCVTTTISTKIEDLLEKQTSCENKLSQMVMNLIMVEIATSGCYKSLTHEHSLAKADSNLSKRKQKKLKTKEKHKGVQSVTTLPIKRYGDDSVLTLRTDSSTQEWKGGKLLRPHWRRPHMATRLKGKGPDKRKEQVLVKGSLVTGEGARLQRMKRAALKLDTAGSQMLDN